MVFEKDRRQRPLIYGDKYELDKPLLKNAANQVRLPIPKRSHLADGEDRGKTSKRY